MTPEQMLAALAAHGYTDYDDGLDGWLTWTIATEISDPLPRLQITWRPSVGDGEPGPPETGTWLLTDPDTYSVIEHADTLRFDEILKRNAQLERYLDAAEDAIKQLHDDLPPCPACGCRTSDDPDANECGCDQGCNDGPDAPGVNVLKARIAVLEQLAATILSTFHTLQAGDRVISSVTPGDPGPVDHAFVSHAKVSRWEDTLQGGS